MNRPQSHSTPTFTQVFVSVVAAFFGVQSARNRVRDFTHGNPLHYLIMALLLTGSVVLCFIAAAKLALYWAGQ